MEFYQNEYHGVKHLYYHISVYLIKCSNCSTEYIGEIEQSKKKRVAEHHCSSSPVGHHLEHAFTKSLFSDKEVSILHQQSQWFCRGVAKAIHTSIRDPSLNRDRGCHTLPAIYRELISPHDLSPTSRSCDIATMQ